MLSGVYHAKGAGLLSIECMGWHWAHYDQDDAMLPDGTAKVCSTHHLGES